VAAALLLHMLVGTAVLVRPPAFLAKLVKPKEEVRPPPRQAEIEMVQAPQVAAQSEAVQNNMPADGDDQVGATGKAKVNAAQQPSATPPVAPPAAPPAQAPPPAPNLVTGPEGESPPPQPAPSPKPGPSAPDAAQQVTQAEQKPTDAPTGAAPEISLSGEDDEQGMSGGSAETPAAPAPGAHNRLPAYPLSAGLKQQEGTVDVIIQVGPDGSAAQVIVANSSGFPALDNAAVRAFKKWRFRPALNHGVPVASVVEKRLKFELGP
jgi:protein TonB